jgi:uncharacterized protein YndB with AHSA1/START domain
LATLDVTDEAIIRAEPEVVYEALVDEHSGRSQWWRPYLAAEPRTGSAYDAIGAVVDNTVGVHGKWPIRFATKTIAARRAESIRVADVEGAFRGEGQWSFEPTEGGTRSSYRWHVSATGVLRMLAPLLPIEKSHSETMQACFDNLNRLLADLPHPAEP